MSYFETLSLYHIGLGLLLLYIGYYAHWELTIGASRRRMIKEFGCKPVRPYVEGPPYSWLNGFLGLGFALETQKALKNHSLLELSLRRFQKTGFTWRSRFLRKEFVVTIEPENVKTMLATNFKDWNLPDMRKDAFIPLFGRGIFTTDGAEWQHSRELLRPNFARSQVSDLEMLDGHVDSLLQAIPRDGSTVDLQDLFFRFALDFATEFLFGESTNCLAPGTLKESNSQFANALDRSQFQVGLEIRNPMSRFFGNSQFKKDVKYVHSVVDHWVKLGLEYRKNSRLKESADDRYTFLFELVKSTEDPIRIRSELLNILLAGRDTTSCLLSNTFFVLAKRPEIWAKLRTEVEGLGGGRPTSDKIRNMKYLRAVLNESLRVYPIVQANARMAIVDTVLPRGGGPDGQSPILIPAKQDVGYSLYSMHRRKDYYGEDAEEFKPERWDSLRPTWEYLPFNGGPRICIGQQLALMEASYVIVRIMQEFKTIESRDPQPWIERLNIVCSSLNGAKVALTPA